MFGDNVLKLCTQLLTEKDDAKQKEIIKSIKEYCRSNDVVQESYIKQLKEVDDRVDNIIKETRSIRLDNERLRREASCAEETSYQNERLKLQIQDLKNKIKTSELRRMDMFDMVKMLIHGKKKDLFQAVVKRQEIQNEEVVTNG